MPLRELRISNVAVVTDGALDIGAAFTALTGETGAGKSVCINALRAVLGGRFDADMLRQGAASARVAAVFDEVAADVTARLAELGIPDDELLTLSRELIRGGRGTCRINGALVSQTSLREIGEMVVEVTTQGASHRLLRRQWQREMLDSSGGSATLNARDDLELAVRQWRTASAGLETAQHAALSSAGEVERARHLVADLATLDLRSGEDAALQTERLRLRNAARITEAALRIADAAAHDESGAADVLAAAVADAAELGGIDAGARALCEEASDLVSRLRDLGLDARSHAASIEIDEMRLALVEERLDMIARVTRRHGSVENALVELRNARDLVDTADGGEGMLDRLEAEARAARDAATAAATALSAARVSAARRLERSVTSELRALELPRARFRVVLGRTPEVDGLDCGDRTPVRCGLHGIDDVEFRLATGRDNMPTPLDEGPSGGELSRLALAIAAVITDARAGALVLDEVDSGIGGETAARVGDVLAAIGRTRQVIAVTHRPEIAARAQQHLLVSKQDAAGGAVATIRPVDGQQRVHEVARLMSGRATESALTRAAELLDEGGGRKPARPERAAGVRTM